MATEQSFPLHEACRDGKLSVVKELVSEAPELCTTKDLDGRYPLHWAVSFQHEPVVEYLLSQMEGQDLDELVDESGWSPLHVASSVGNLAIVKTLMDSTNMPDVNLATSSGTTALHLACSKMHYKIAEYLVIVKRASTRIKDKHYQLALHRAASVGSVPLVKLLCDYGSPVNTKDSQGWAPLFHALAEGNGDVAVTLVQDYHAEFRDIQNSKGQTPLQVAVDEKVRDYFLKNVL